jgi:hypothetical protein
MFNMKKYFFIGIILILITIPTGCTYIKPVSRPAIKNDPIYAEKGWKIFIDKQKEYSVYYDKSWFLRKSGRDYIQLTNFDPEEMVLSQAFTGNMVKTEIYWQELTDGQLDYYPEVEKVSTGNYRLKRTRYHIKLNGLQAERWTGKDVLKKRGKGAAAYYDKNSLSETDLTTEIVTGNKIFIIASYTSGELSRVPQQDILMLHDSFVLLE